MRASGDVLKHAEFFSGGGREGGEGEDGLNAKFPLEFRDFGINVRDLPCARGAISPLYDKVVTELKIEVKIEKGERKKGNNLRARCQS